MQVWKRIENISFISKSEDGGRRLLLPWVPVYNVHNCTKMGKARGVEWIVYLLLSTEGRAFYHKRLCTFTVSIICSKAGRFLFLCFTGCMRCPIVFEFRVKIRLKNRGFEEVKNCSKTSEVETERQMTFIPSTWRSRTQVMAILLTTNSGATVRGKNDSDYCRLVRTN